MCGRYASFTRLDEQPGLFDLDLVTDEVTDLAPRWNVAPTTMVPIILERTEDSRSREAHAAHWGLIPIWAKDPAIGSRMINARKETLTEKKSFAPLLKSKRCIVPADGYYEWTGEKGNKIPHYITQADGGLLAFAGLYSWWKSETGWLLSTTIITQEADQLAHIHHRTPHILSPADYDAWLDPELESPLEVLDEPNPELAEYVVSTAVNRVGVDGPQLIEQV